VLPYGFGPQSKPSVHGIRIVDGVPNDLISGSGEQLASRPLDAPYPTLPKLGGAYRSLTHPRRVYDRLRVTRHCLAH
jgi:hypothetical protein